MSQRRRVRQALSEDSALQSDVMLVNVRRCRAFIFPWPGYPPGQSRRPRERP